MIKSLMKPFIWSILFLVGVLSYTNLQHVSIVENIGTVIKKVDPRQLACLAENIFHEAGGETLMGQAAVARVVINRINHGFGKTPCAVVHQESIIVSDDGENKRVCQFSWWCDETKSSPNKNSPAYIHAKSVAYQVLAHDAYRNVLPSNTLFFHNSETDPKWKYQKVKQIGNHVFYNKKKTSEQ